MPGTDQQAAIAAAHDDLRTGDGVLVTGSRYGTWAVVDQDDTA